MIDSDRLTLGLLADFSGSARSAISKRRFIPVDRDTIDDAIAAFAPEALLELPFCHSLRISQWSDFRPDQIARRVPEIKALLDARNAVSQIEIVGQHLARAGAALDINPEVPRRSFGTPADSAAGAQAATADNARLLDSIVDSTGTGPPPHNLAESSFDRMVRAIAEQSGASGDFAREDARRAAIDEELGRRIRAILHHPRFQSLEASWRSALQIVRAGGETALRLFDLRLPEVISDAGRPEGERALDERIGPTANPAEQASRFSFLLCGMEVGDDDDGRAACAHLSGLAAGCRASLVIGLHPTSLSDAGVPSQAWREQLAGPVGDTLVLVQPRVLLRLPYGEQTDSIDEFDFEELEQFETEPETSAYLWGSAALALGIALVSWSERGGAFGEITTLPMHVFRSRGEVRSTGPVAELLSESRIEQLNDAGVTCLVGSVAADRVQVVGLRSLSGRSVLASPEEPFGLGDYLS